MPAACASGWRVRPPPPAIRHGLPTASPRIIGRPCPPSPAPWTLSSGAPAETGGKEAAAARTARMEALIGLGASAPSQAPRPATPPARPASIEVHEPPAARTPRARDPRGNRVWNQCKGAPRSRLHRHSAGASARASRMPRRPMRRSGNPTPRCFVAETPARAAAPPHNRQPVTYRQAHGAQDFRAAAGARRSRHRN